MTATAAIAAVARRELRRGWGGLLAIGLVAGVAAAVATGGVVVERRTATAEARLKAAMSVEDLRVMSLGGSIPSTAGIDGITRQWRPAFAVGRVEGAVSLNYVAVLSGPPHPGIFNPVVVAGRAVRPAAADEVVVAESGAAELGLRVGSRLPLKFLTAEQAGDWNTGIGEPRGPTVTLRVVGLTRITPRINSVAVMGGPAFYARYGASLGQGGALLLRTAPGTDPQDVARQLGARAPNAGLQFMYSSRTPAPIRTSAHILSGGALSFVLVAALVGLIALAQMTARHHSAGVRAQQVERILGLTAGERVLAHAGPAVLSALVAAGLAAAGGIAAGAIEPLGALRTSEPDPGFQLNAAVAAGGAVLAVLAVLVTSAVGAARATAARAGGREPLRSMRLQRSAVASAGFRLAAGGRGAVRLLSVGAGVTLAVAGLLASFGVSASLRHLSTTPGVWGSTAQLSVADARPELADRLRTDPRIAALTAITAGRVLAGGQDAASYSTQHVLGDRGWTLTAGREPFYDHEVVLGTKLADRLRSGLGDRVRLSTRHGPESLTVTGIGIGSPDSETLGNSLLLTPGGLISTTRTDPYLSLDVTLRDPKDVDALAGELQGEWELVRPPVPAEVSSLRDLGRLPLYLALFFAAVGLAATAHASALLLRRSRRELAVLHTIGFTRAQVAGGLLVATLTTAAVGLVLGVPTGLLLGRLVWWQVADGIGVVPVIRLPVAVAVVAVPAVLLVTAALTVAPTAAARAEPLSRALRSE